MPDHGVAYAPTVATPQAAGSTEPGAVWVRRDAVAPYVPVRHQGQSHMAVRLRLNTSFERKSYGQAAMQIKLDAWVAHTAPVDTGNAWLNFVFEANADGGGLVSMGGTDIALLVGEFPNGEYRPAALHSAQQSGITTYITRPTVYTDDGRPVPVVQVPPQVEHGGGQLSFMLASLGDPVMPEGTLMETLVGIQTPATGHPKTLIIRFFLPCNEHVIVAVPPVADWDTLAERSGITPLPEDIEYFYLGSGVTPAVPALSSWADIPDELAWNAIPDDLTWNDADDALWAEN